jgi:hypothetical protein
MKKSNSTKATAAILAIILSATFSIGTVSSTEAWGLKSVYKGAKKGVKKVGSTAKKGTAKVGNAAHKVKNTVKKLGKANTYYSAGRYVGGKANKGYLVAKKYAPKVGKGLKRLRGCIVDRKNKKWRPKHGTPKKQYHPVWATLACSANKPQR